MALVVAKPSAKQTAKPSDSPFGSLEEAISEFEGALTDTERKTLRDIKTVPDADAVMLFTAQLDACNRTRRGRSIATRLHSVLQSVRDYSNAIDTLVSSHPEIAALVWGSIKLTMLIISNYASYFEEISNLFMRFRGQYPVFEEYQALFPASPGLQTAISEFHASIIRCCRHAVAAIQRPWQSQLFNSFRQSFEQEFEPDKLRIQDCSKRVKQQIYLAKAKMDRDHQILQKMEREITKDKLSRVLSLSGHSNRGIDDLRQLQNQLQDRMQKQELLTSISSYDYGKAYRDARQKRHYSTAEWIFSTDEFERWHNQLSPSILWCTGKIGSGKTVLTASAIDHVALKKKSEDRVAYFFLRFDEPQSLKAEAILRSILRQALELGTFSQEIESELAKMKTNSFSGISDLLPVLRKIIQMCGLFYIFIDAVDECEPAERRSLLDAISSLSTVSTGTVDVNIASASSSLRVFLAGRESLSKELGSRFPAMQRISTTSTKSHSDISTYVEEIIRNRNQAGELQVNDELLLQEIQERLVKHADGMFLWVTYLIDELCTQYCDDDIRSALDNLPKSLKETFDRALSRIESRQHATLANKIFQWVAVAKRNLTLDEIGEAISVEIGQKSSNPGRRLNNHDSILSWCENLLQLDEAYATIQFAHRTIFDYITGDRTSRVGGMHVDLKEADHHAGEICMTYLHHSDFQTTLATRQAHRSFRIDPAAIASFALGTGRLRGKVAGYVAAQQSRGQSDYDIGNIASYARANSDEAMDSLLNAHPFLRYAAAHWIAHTAQFEQYRSKTWTLLCRVVTDGHELAQTPWEGPAKTNYLAVLQWIFKTRHFALFRIMWQHQWFDSVDMSEYLVKSAALGYTEFLDYMFTKDKYREAKNKALAEACAGGHLDTVNRLLSEGYSVEAMSENAGPFGTPLVCAIVRGHIDIVKRLIKSCTRKFIEQRSVMLSSPTPLQAACEYGHLEIVELLLQSKAMVNASPGGIGGRTPLQAACEIGHVKIIEVLLAAGANVNAEPASVKGTTALEAACKLGHLEIIHRLLLEGAVVDYIPEPDGGRNALQAACERGHLEAVNLLLDAGANVNESPAPIRGRTALQAAAGGGHLEVVRRLLAEGADVHQEAQGWTALQAASECGHLGTVKMLLEASPKLNKDVLLRDGLNAVLVAATRGHMEVVAMILENCPRLDILVAISAARLGGNSQALQTLENILDEQEDEVYLGLD